MEAQEYIRNFIVDNFLFEDGSQLKDSDSLMQTGVIDSTGVLELIFFLEKTYQITIAPAELTPDNMDSVEKIAQFIARKSQALKPLAARPLPGSPAVNRESIAAIKH